MRRTLAIALIAVISPCVGSVGVSAAVCDHDPLAQYAIEYSRPLWQGKYALAPIEGVWLTTAGAYIAIHATGVNDYEMTVIHSPDLGILPGTCMGSARTSGKLGMYDATIFRKFTADGKGVSPQRLAVTIDIENGMMRFDPYKQGWSINLRRLIPYLFRVSVHHEDTRPDGIDGATRIYPAPPPTIQDPIVP